MKVIIDRFEGDFAVVEMPDKQFVNVPKQIIPPEASDGDVLLINIDHTETKQRKEKILKLMNDLWKD